MSAGLSTVCFLNTSEYCPIPVRKLLSKRQKITKVGEDVEKREPSGTAGGMYCGAAAMETVWRFRKKLNRESIMKAALYPIKKIKEICFSNFLD